MLNILIASYQYGKEIINSIQSVLNFAPHARIIIKTKIPFSELQQKIVLSYPLDIVIKSGDDTGIYDAFNQLVCSVSNADDWLLFLGMGDVLTDKFIDFYNCILLYPEEAMNVYFGITEIVDTKGHFIRKSITYPGEVVGSKCVHGRPYAPCHQSVVVKKKYFDMCGMFNNVFFVAGDAEFLLRLEKKGISFVLVPFVMSKMKAFGKSSSIKFFRLQMHDAIMIYRLYGIHSVSKTICFVLFSFKRLVSFFFYYLLFCVKIKRS